MIRILETIVMVCYVVKRTSAQKSNKNDFFFGKAQKLNLKQE